MMLDGLGFIVMLLNLLLHKVAIASSLLHRMTYEMLTFPLTLWSSGPSGASDTIFKCHHGVQTKLQSQQTNITTLNSKCPNSISSISLVNSDSHIKFVNHFGNLVPLYQFHKLFFAYFCFQSITAGRLSSL